jgi:hypothetical protein
MRLHEAIASEITLIDIAEALGWDPEKADVFGVRDFLDGERPEALDPRIWAAIRKVAEAISELDCVYHDLYDCGDCPTDRPMKENDDVE